MKYLPRDHARITSAQFNPDAAREMRISHNVSQSQFLLAAALALPTAGLSTAVGVIGLTAVSTSAEAQACVPPKKKMRNPAAECLRRAGAPYKRNPPPAIAHSGQPL